MKHEAIKVGKKVWIKPEVRILNLTEEGKALLFGDKLATTTKDGAALR